MSHDSVHVTCGVADWSHAGGEAGNRGQGPGGHLPEFPTPVFLLRHPGVCHSVGLTPCRSGQQPTGYKSYSQTFFFSSTLEVFFFFSDSTLGTETLLQLHTVLTEALTFVLHLLSVTSRGRAAHPAATPSPSSEDLARLLREHPIVTAAVRILGAWLAEDSLTLSGEVYSILPFLVELCVSASPRQPEEDLLKFLLPGLCHMTVDDKARPVLVDAGLGRILSRYMQQLWELSEDSRLVWKRLV